MLSRLVHRLLLPLLGFAAGAFCPAQCATGWQLGVSDPPGAILGGSLPGAVYASTMWDPDGAGPQLARLVVVGKFSFVGSVFANAIAVQDPTTGTWGTLGAGFNGECLAVAALPSGELVVGGQFTLPAPHVARWNGTAWSGMPGLTAPVRALTVLPTGEVVAAADGARVARWTGTSWIQFGPMIGQVNAVHVRPSGQLVAGGAFGSPVQRVAAWNGSAWTSLGADAPTIVTTLATAANGDLLAGGTGVWRWNGAAWSLIGGSGQTIYTLAVAATGEIFVGGFFANVNGVSCGSIAELGVAGWSGMGGGFSITQRFVHTITVLPNGNVVAGGQFVSASGVSCTNLAEWNGAAWAPMTPGGFGSGVYAGTTLANGDTVVGGLFTSTPNGPAAGVARWDGITWSSLGSGITNGGIPGEVYALASMPNGDVLAGGRFTAAGGVPISNIARWDGTVWSPLGSGLNGQVNALAVRPNGEILAAGYFTASGATTLQGFARWNGTSWQPFGPPSPGGVAVMVTAPNGDVFVGGAFSQIGGVPAANVARWNGTAWSAVGSGPTGGVSGLALLPNGGLVAVGYFTPTPTTSHNVRLWNGSVWTPLPGLQDNVKAVVGLPDGDFLVGGSSPLLFPGSFARVVRWNGTTWTPVGIIDGQVEMMVADASGIPFVGGWFASTGTCPSSFLARLTTNCPTVAASFGAGCPSSGGSNTLTATTHPWVDSTFLATGTGLPLNAAVLAVTSLTSIVPGFPLSAVLPAASGCDLHVAPDIVLGYATSTGSVQSSLFLANVPPLVGLTFFHQLVAFDATGPVTSTNALQLTAGIL